MEVTAYGPVLALGLSLTDLYCTYGTETRGIKINPPNRPANIWDQKAMTNIPPFGGCYSMQNPSVAAINKTFQEAQGPLGPLFGPSQADLGFKKNYGKNVIPGPCKPLFTELWKGSHRLEMLGTPLARAIEKGCRADCIYGGVVKFVK